MFDLALNGGTVFDGSGGPRRVGSVGIKDGRVVAISDAPLPATKTLDCTGKWVMPGFVDVHTHYDAEVEGAPSLSESLRHGVTTIFMGSCSLGAVLSDPVTATGGWLNWIVTVALAVSAGVARSSTSRCTVSLRPTNPTSLR